MFPGKIKKNKEDTKKVSFRLFKEGMKVKEIAEFRELTTGTISNHLLHYVRTGDIKLQELVDQEKINYGIKEQIDTITNRYNKWLYLFHISSC